MPVISQESAFPRLTDSEIGIIRRHAVRQEYRDGDIVFRAGDADIDFFVVESGVIEILNPTDHNKRVTLHTEREFAGDIDLLTRRRVIVTAAARGNTVLLRVQGSELRSLINSVPRLGEKLIIAFTVRREMLQQAGIAGLIVVGDRKEPESSVVQEFLYKNFVPFIWYECDSADGKRELARLKRSSDDCPVIDCGDRTVLSKPTIAELAKCAGVARGCPDRTYDLAIIGAGPAGMTAAVYAASEGLSTVIIDKMGPGGQAAGSSMIENFIGFPSGLSGTELATRGVIQLLKFGALLLSPVDVRNIEQREGEFVVQTDDQDVQAKSVLIASGAKWRKLAAKNASKFDRAGIYYAATAIESRVCQGGEAAVIGAGNSGGQAAMFLSECAKTVHMLVRGDSLEKGMSAYLAKRIRANPKIKVHLQTEVHEVFGNEALTGIKTTCSNTGKSQQIGCAAMYVFIGAEPLTQFLPASIARDPSGYVLTGHETLKAKMWKQDREPLSLESTVPGVFAAGDVRCGSTKRVAFAVGDGAMAVTSVHRFRAMQEQ